MKKEIEVKILNIDPRKLRIRLKKIGAKQLLKPTVFKELYFESPLKKNIYSSFRMRNEGKDNFLTLKLKKEDKRFEIRDEFQVKIDDFEIMKKIFSILNFKIFRQREKIREEYKLGGLKIEIDTYPKMKPYLEIEATNKKDILNFLRKINFPLKYTTNKTATELIRDAGLNPDKLLFEK